MRHLSSRVTQPAQAKDSHYDKLAPIIERLPKKGFEAVPELDLLSGQGEGQLLPDNLLIVNDRNAVEYKLAHVMIASSSHHVKRRLEGLFHEQTQAYS